MVPSITDTPNKPFAVFSFFEWIGILCCGCFGKICHTQTPPPPPLIHSHGDSLSLPHEYIPWRLLHHSSDMGSDTATAARQDCEDDEHVGNDDDDDNDRMFHGIFIMGSKVLTEVELQSPIEEIIAVPTPIRTPQRSNPSSAASSTRQLHIDDSDHACIGGIYPLDAKESDQIPVTPPHVNYKPASLPDGLEYCSSSVLRKKTKESDLLLVEGDEASHSPFPSIKHFVVRSHSVWNDKEIRVDVDSSSECGTPIPFPERRISQGFGKTATSSKQRQKKANLGRWRSRSLTDQDFAEVKGCIDLGFIFTQDHITNLRKTLPALEVCYAIANGAISPACTPEDSKSLSPGSPPISPWRIASLGDKPHQVKARLRHWAQAVACNVRHGC